MSVFPPLFWDTNPHGFIIIQMQLTRLVRVIAPTRNWLTAPITHGRFRTSGSGRWRPGESSVPGSARLRVERIPIYPIGIVLPGTAITKTGD